MRATMTLLLALGSLAGCAYQQTREVSATPPTVSYQVFGNDISQANAQADRYCQQYGMFSAIPLPTRPPPTPQRLITATLQRRSPRCAAPIPCTRICRAAPTIVGRQSPAVPKGSPAPGCTITATL